MLRCPKTSRQTLARWGTFKSIRYRTLNKGWPGLSTPSTKLWTLKNCKGSKWRCLPRLTKSKAKSSILPPWWLIEASELGMTILSAKLNMLSQLTLWEKNGASSTQIKTTTEPTSALKWCRKHLVVSASESTIHFLLRYPTKEVKKKMD